MCIRDRDHVMAFGDEDNDLEMLKECGIGVVMANGSQKALAIADEKMCIRDRWYPCL